MGLDPHFGLIAVAYGFNEEFPQSEPVRQDRVGRTPRLHPLFTAHAAENADHRILASQERGDALFQIAQRVAMFGEDRQLWADGGPAPFRDSFSMGPGVKISESRSASSRHFRSVPLRRTARASPSICFRVSISDFSSTIVRAAVAWSRICSSAASTSLSGASSRSSTSSSSSAGASTRIAVGRAPPRWSNSSSRRRLSTRADRSIASRRIGATTPMRPPPPTTKGGRTPRPCGRSHPAQRSRRRVERRNGEPPTIARR